jgi:hypothetical protein
MVPADEARNLHQSNKRRLSFQGVDNPEAEPGGKKRVHRSMRLPRFVDTESRHLSSYGLVRPEH